MTKKNPHEAAVALAKQRAAKLTPERRAEISRQAAEVHWAVELVSWPGCDPNTPEGLENLLTRTQEALADAVPHIRAAWTILASLKRTGLWKRTLPTGDKTWERFCQEVLGYEASFINHLISGATALKERQHE